MRGLPCGLAIGQVKAIAALGILADFCMSSGIPAIILGVIVPVVDDSAATSLVQFFPYSAGNRKRDGILRGGIGKLVVVQVVAGNVGVVVINLCVNGNIHIAVTVADTSTIISRGSELIWRARHQSNVVVFRD